MTLEIQMDLGLLGKETCSAKGKSQLSHPVLNSSPLQVQHFLRKIISRINKEEETEAPITALFWSLGSLTEPCFMPYPLPAVPLGPWCTSLLFASGTQHQGSSHNPCELFPNPAPRRTTSRHCASLARQD